MAEIEETIDVIEVVVSSDFLLTNEIKVSKNTKTYHEALAEVRRRKEYPYEKPMENKETSITRAKQLMDSW